ncbi:hypothetical protein PGTUg99_011214 [Puccinia graminis f. sp. tritici]|uniref:Secreted protein n=1 Tax=Puccinia graminis f. sp. tritici TaxID=56615 RepID=A0A5B0QG17_PUCGR|nr:hypothetical protein PGTUg99_011214 [Puccinia graminis f. sp. tritici]
MQLIQLFQFLMVLIIQRESQADPFDCSKAGSEGQRHFTKPICVQVLKDTQPLHPGGGGPQKYYRIHRNSQEL